MNVDAKTMQNNFNEKRRIALLLADRAVQVLPDEELDELNGLLALHPDTDASELDQAAAALHLAKPILPESLPSALRARLFVEAQRFFAAQESVSKPSPVASVAAAAVRGKVEVDPHIQPDLSAAHAAVTPPAQSFTKTVTETETVSPAQAAAVLAFPSALRQSSWAEKPQAKPTSNWFGRLGWLAAAACLAFAVVGAWKVREQQKLIAAIKAPPRPASIDFAAQRRALIAQGGQLVQLNWATAAYPGMEKVRGDVVWSDAAQQGYMRFVGMPANDPDKLVYQLWIFAANQDEKYPIDGGVFNINNSPNRDGEIIVPINAKLLVSQPGLFAVTIEKPGGVVVSKRDKLALLAKVG